MPAPQTATPLTSAADRGQTQGKPFPTEADVVVIGGGIAGICTALFLA